MTHRKDNNFPYGLDHLEKLATNLSFNQTTERSVGRLLRTLVASKLSGRLLELGTGVGTSLIWMLEGLSEGSNLISIDNNPEFYKYNQEHFGDHAQLELICEDGFLWLEQYEGPSFDLIFADSWPGKYGLLNHTLSLVSPGGLYIVDDMLPQDNWPEGHDAKAKQLFNTLAERKDFHFTFLEIGSGVIICTKK